MKKLFLSLLIFQSFGIALAQNSPFADSLENLLLHGEADSQRVSVLAQLSWYYCKRDHIKALSRAEEALLISEKIHFNRGLILSNYYIALVHQYQGDYRQALEKHLMALKLCEQQNGTMRETEKDTLLVQIYNAIGNTFCLQERRDEGLEYFNVALEKAKKTGMKYYEATILGNLGNIYYFKSFNSTKKSWDTVALNLTLKYYSQAVNIHALKNDSVRMITPLMNIALVQIELGQIKDALRNLHNLKAFCIRINDIANLVYINSNIGQASARSDNLPLAMEFFDQAIELASGINDRNSLMDIYGRIAHAYAEKKDFRIAYENYVKYSQLRDSLLNEENSNSISEMQVKYETEQKEKKIKIQSNEIQKKQFLIYAASLGLFLMILFGIVTFRGYKQKKKSNKIISQQKQLVEEKNRNITESIQYASRIQSAILPGQDSFQILFPDSFIFYRPRDIVSGDFYWFCEKDGHKMLAVADCTGHGVPGAMMSMVGTSLLHQIVNEKTISNPSEVLAELDRQVIRSLKQTGAEGENREGMDISFIEINKEHSLLKFSGANHTLYILRNGMMEELPGSKHPIGCIMKKTKNFELKEYELQKGDCVYLTTDGISDQFGSKTNKKFMTRRFRQSLVKIQGKAMIKQKEELVEIIDEWKGNYEQIDDICVIGIKI